MRKRKRKFIVSVKDFGARGDGFTDDTEAFKLAMQSRANCVLVPPGCYELKGQLKLDHRFVSTEPA